MSNKSEVTFCGIPIEEAIEVMNMYKNGELIHLKRNEYVYEPTTIHLPNTYIPEACRSCINHPSNGGTGICACTLGSPTITCNSTGHSWK